MRTNSRHFKQTSAADMSTLKKNAAHETEIVETERELTSYAHCRLPEHYFDMLLYKSQQRLSATSGEIEQSGIAHYR